MRQAIITPPPPKTQPRHPPIIVAAAAVASKARNPWREICRGEGGDPPKKRIVPLTQGDLARYARAMQAAGIGAWTVESERRPDGTTIVRVIVGGGEFPQADAYDLGTLIKEIPDEGALQ